MIPRQLGRPSPQPPKFTDTDPSWLGTAVDVVRLMLRQAAPPNGRPNQVAYRIDILPSPEQALEPCETLPSSGSAFRVESRLDSSYFSGINGCAEPALIPSWS